MMKKYFTKKSITDYLYDAFTGNLLGFLVGMSATGIVSRFFETRSINNLWGFRAKKALLSKEAFENIEWILSIVIGFFVLELYDKVLKEKLRILIPIYYTKTSSYFQERGWTEKAGNFKMLAMKHVKEKSSVGKEMIKNIYRFKR